MKIFMLNTLYHPNVMGGAERVVQSLAESLVERGHEVSVASAAPGDGLKTEKLNGVTVHYLGVPHSFWPYDPDRNPKHVKLAWKALDTLNVGMLRGLDRLLDRERPDLVHTHNLPGFSAAAWHSAKARRLPLVHSVHDYGLLCARSSMFKRMKNCAGQCAACRLFSYSKKRSSGLVDAVVTATRFVLERHLRYGFFTDTRQREVIFYGYDNPGQPPARSPGPMSPLRLGYLGRLQPTKGIDWLFETLRNMPFQDWEIWLAGTGDAPYVDSLKRRYASPRVHFLGFIPPEELFARVHFLLVPSLWHEPFGRIIIEAYAHGVPVIAADRGGITEIVDHGRTGFLIDPDSPHTLWNAIRSVSQDAQLVAPMRLNALEKAKEFSMREMVDRYIALYDRIST
jgi:glycosyltransferase involved in cell wall biosynthesis